MSPPALSVVVSVASEETPVEMSALRDALGAVRASCEGLATEIIVVFAGDAEVATAMATRFPDVIVERAPAETLAPVLWGLGMQRARGDVVSLTTTDMRVDARWARALLAEFGERGDSASNAVVGVGGPIALGPRFRGAADAMYFLRFSAYQPSLWPVSRRAHDIPGDNAAYRRDAVIRHTDLLTEGFWEVEFHRRFEREGLVLKMTPDAVATCVGAMPGGAAVRQRWNHARAFGVSRVKRHGQSVLRIVMAAPLVPLVLMARIARRLRRGDHTTVRFAGAIPWLTMLTASWAAGECVGAMQR